MVDFRGLHNLDPTSMQHHSLPRPPNVPLLRVVVGSFQRLWAIICASLTSSYGLEGCIWGPLSSSAAPRQDEPPKVSPFLDGPLISALVWRLLEEKHVKMYRGIHIGYVHIYVNTEMRISYVYIYI